MIFQAVYAPLGMLNALDHSSLAQAGEMLGDEDLGYTENLLKVANTKRPTAQQVKNSKPRRVG
jgi:hypothetical protein